MSSWKIMLYNRVNQHPNNNSLNLNDITIHTNRLLKTKQNTNNRAMVSVFYFTVKSMI